MGAEAACCARPSARSRWTSPSTPRWSSTRRAGAVVTFAGVVRDHDGGRSVCRAGVQRAPHGRGGGGRGRRPRSPPRADGVRAIAVSHRVGRLGVGDVALACAVAADHRREAFATCAELVDEVKRLLPVWKHQEFADGTDEWVNSA